MRRRRSAGTWLVVGLVLVSCGAEGPKVPSATVPTAPPATVASDPYAVPEVIDEAYVNRVLAGLDAAVGDVVRLVVRERAVTPEAIERLEAIYDGPFEDLNVVSLQNDVDARFVGYRLPPGDQRTEVADLLTARPECVFARVGRDYSAVSSALIVENEWVALRRAGTTATNPTGWVLTYDGFEERNSAPDDPCA